MNDLEKNAILLALDAAYDTLKQPPSSYCDVTDFEADRLDAVDKLLRAMQITGMEPELVKDYISIPPI